ncbi:hypothetical protein [uncultured Victivallis sp.]|uniref:hypothetical protein n=1 Tax=uncultured Victivallis sp. TaxID=354118 RepID=UPI002600B197|nr:hypothetical protein [uncultured Victivallis sp.]
MFISDILKTAAALLFTVCTLHAAGVVTSDGVELAVSGDDAAETAELLKAFDRQLCTVFRVNSRRSPIRCRITASPNAAPGGLLFRAKRNNWELEFNTALPGWQEDLDLWRRLAGILLLAKRGGPVPGNPAYLPIWIAAGLRAEMVEQESAGRLLRRNRHYPITRALLAAHLPLPDFRYMTGELDPSRFAPGELRWYREFSRLLLEILYQLSSPADNALLDYALLSAEPGHSADQVRAATIERILQQAASRNAQKRDPASRKSTIDIQRFLENKAEEIVWHLFSPMPPEIAESRFQAINRLELPVLDAEGEPTGQKETVPLETLPDRLAGRPDEDALRNRKLTEIYRLAPGNSPEVLARYRELSEALRELPLHPEAPGYASACGRFRRALAEVERYFTYRARLEEKLDEYARRAASPADWYSDRIEALRRTPPFLTEKAGQLLERTEKRYLEE